MNRDQSSFFSDLLQNLGFLATAIIAFTQYSLSSSFQFLFRDDPSLLKVSSLAALISSIGIFLGFFALRFNLTNKIYFSKKDKDKYLESLSKQNDQQEGKKAFISEPKNFSILYLAFFFIILSIACFSIALTVKNLNLISLNYILFIDFAIASLSIFSIQLYRDREISKKNDEINEIILNKIRVYFIGDIKIIYDSTDPFQFVGPNRHIIFEYKEKKYDVFTKSYNPDSYFLLSEHK